MADNDRDIGELKAEVRTLNRLVEEVRGDLKEMREEFAQVRGGWKAVIMVAAMAGGALSWLTNYFLGKH